MSNVVAILDSTVEFLFCEHAFAADGWRENESVGSFVGFYDILRDAGNSPIGLRLESGDDEVNLLLDRFPDSPKFRKDGPSGRYLFFLLNRVIGSPSYLAIKCLRMCAILNRSME